MDYGFGEETNKRVQKVMDEFMLQIAEKEYLQKNGHSLRSEKFANHLITSSPDGIGIFVFEEDTPWEMWKYTKMMGMVAFKENPIELYRTLDDIMNSLQQHTVTLMTMRFGEDGQIDTTNKDAIIYAIHGTHIRPFTDEENEGLAVSLEDLNVTFKKAEPWTYDAYGEYTKLVV